MCLSIYQLECDRHLIRVRGRRRRCALASTSNIPLATIAMRKAIHGFPLLSYMSMGLRLAAPELRYNLDRPLAYLQQNQTIAFICLKKVHVPIFERGHYLFDVRGTYNVQGRILDQRRLWCSIFFENLRAGLGSREDHWDITRFQLRHKQSREVFRPIVCDRKCLMVYNENYWKKLTVLPSLPS